MANPHAKTVAMRITTTSLQIRTTERANKRLRHLDATRPEIYVLWIELRIWRDEVGTLIEKSGRLFRFMPCNG